MSLHVAGIVVADPMSMWRIYADNFGRTIRHYDLASRAGRHREVLAPDEAWRSRFVHSRMTYQERDEMVGPGSRCSST
jgi:hypothetical protein